MSFPVISTADCNWQIFCLVLFYLFSTTDFPDVLRVGDSYSYAYLPAEDTGADFGSDIEYAWLESR